LTRLTRTMNSNGKCIVDWNKVQEEDQGYSGEAIVKLARYEDFHTDLLSQQVGITAEMERLRQAGQTRSVKFRQLLGNKVSNNNVMILMRSYGLL
jgi:hypothetical protein